MNQQTIAEVVNNLHDFPENKLNSLLDYIEFLKYKHLNEEEKAIILKSAKEKKTVEWEKSKRQCLQENT